MPQVIIIGTEDVTVQRNTKIKPILKDVNLMYCKIA